jgi:hypothetical protein
MNTANFIFQLLHIHNLPTLVVLTPPCSPCTPSDDYTHLSINYVNSFVDYFNKSNDCVNTSANSADTHDKPSLDLYIPNPSLLQLLLTNLFVIYRSTINIVLTIRSSLCSSSSILFICGFYISRSSSSSSVS